MPISISCPACKRRLNVPDKLQGKRVKCPSCGEGFEAAETSIQPEKPSKPKAASEAIATTPKRPPKPPEEEFEEPLTEPEPEEEEEPKPRRRRSRDDDDEDEDDRPRRKRRRRDDDDEDDDYDVRRKPKRAHRGGLILTLGILSLFLWCCPLIGWVVGGIAMNMAKTDLAAMSAGYMDKSGRSITVAGNICAIVGVVLSTINAVAGIIMRVTGRMQF